MDTSNSTNERVFRDATLYIRTSAPLRMLFTCPNATPVKYLQIYVVFMNTTTTPEVCWPLISFGLRMAQDVGAHRKKPGNIKPTLESELWKRSFWMLYIMDIFVSAFLGRPRSIANEEQVF